MTPRNPEYLYRYCSAERAAQVLRDNTLYLCPPADFNDLYEGTVARLTQYDFKAGLALVSKIASLRHGLTIESAQEMLEGRMPEPEIRKTFEEVSAWLRDPAEKLRLHSGVTCFSVRRDDQHMWGTYGVNSNSSLKKGFCLRNSARLIPGISPAGADGCENRLISPQTARIKHRSRSVVSDDDSPELIHRCGG